MSGPGRLDLTVYQGDDFVATFLFRPPAIDNVIQEPWDFTNCTVKSQIKQTESAAGTLVASFACTVPTQTGDAKGTFTLVLDHDTATGIPAKNPGLGDGMYWWDVQVTFPTGGRRTFLKGRVTVENEITT